VPRRVLPRRAAGGHAAPRRQPGFTLLELIIVLVLISLVLALAAPSLRRFIRSRETSETASHLLALTHLARSQAAALAQTKLAELVATDQWYDGELEGDFGEDWPDYRWEAQAIEWEDARMVELDVGVFWTRRGQDHDVILSTLIYTGTPNETY